MTNKWIDRNGLKLIIIILVVNFNCTHERWLERRVGSESYVSMSAKVLDSITQNPIPNAFVTVNYLNATTDQNGEFSLFELNSVFVDVEVASVKEYKAFRKSNVYLSSRKPNKFMFHMDALVNMRDQNIDLLFERLHDFVLKRASSFKAPTTIHHMSHNKMQASLKGSVMQCAEVMRMYSIGTSVQGRKLWAVEVSSQPGHHRPGVPEVKYIGNMHGNEVVGRVLLVALVEWMCLNRHHPLMQLLITTTCLHILPTMNPDGYSEAEEGDVDGVVGRTNHNNVDLNRNFPDQFHHTSDNAVQEPETKQVMAWLQSLPFVLSANLHGGTLVANFPFDDLPSQQDHGYSSSPDDRAFRMIAQAYARHHPKMHANHQCHNHDHFKQGITNGADWYSVAGGMQDWNYLHTNCFEVTLEISCVKYPVQKHLAGYWQDNKVSLVNFIAQAHKGFKGWVRDAYTGEGIADASVFIASIKHAIYSSAMGDFWRILSPGLYHVTVAREGYISWSGDVRVSNATATTLTIYLESFNGWRRQWVLEEDFGIVDNLEDKYLNLNQLSQAVQDIVSINKPLIQLHKLTHADRSLNIIQFNTTNMHASEDRQANTHSKRESKRRKLSERKLRVLLLGSLWRGDVLTSNLLLKLLRHLIGEYNYNKHNNTLSNIHLSIIPTLDLQHWLDQKPACESPDPPEELLQPGSTETWLLEEQLHDVDVLICLQTSFTGVGLSSHFTPASLQALNSHLHPVKQSNPVKQLDPVKQSGPVKQPVSACRAASTNHLLEVVEMRHARVRMLTYGVGCCMMPEQGADLMDAWINNMPVLSSLLQFIPSLLPIHHDVSQQHNNISQQQNHVSQQQNHVIFAHTNNNKININDNNINNDNLKDNNNLNDNIDNNNIKANNNKKQAVESDALNRQAIMHVVVVAVVVLLLLACVSCVLCLLLKSKSSKQVQWSVLKQQDEEEE